MRIVREGWPFILGPLVASDLFMLGHIFWHSAFCLALAVLLLVATAFCAYFFRDPARVVPKNDRLILCPADGKVMEVVEGQDASASGPVWVVRIFLSVFDPHLQRSPVAGMVKSIDYKTGKFLDARDSQAAFENEQNRIVIVPSPQPSPKAGEGGVPSPFLGEGGRRPDEGTIVVTQIAGLIARRIVCWVKEGQAVKAGERIGLIRFGSQVDIVLPKSSTVKVKPGDVVTAGDTVLAER